jgi:hypothetical protein
VRLDVLRQRSPGEDALVVVLGVEDAVHVVERELRVDRKQFLGPDDRVDPLAAREPELELVGVRGEHVREKVREQQLAEAAPRLRRAQGLLQALQIVCALEHALRARLDPGELLGDLGRGLAGAALCRQQPAVETLEAPVNLGVELAEPAVEPRLDPDERAVELLGRAAELGAQRASEADRADGERGRETRDEKDEHCRDHGRRTVEIAPDGARGQVRSLADGQEGSCPEPAQTAPGAAAAEHAVGAARHRSSAPPAVHPGRGRADRNRDRARGDLPGRR